MSTLTEYFDGAADNLRWTRFEPRPGDIIITTPPKAGTTLTQMMTSLLVFDGPDFPGRLDDFSPWLDQITRTDREALGVVASQSHRRIIKTHTPLDGIPPFDDVAFISVHRDPRDVFVSWIHHAANIDVTAILTAIEAAGYLDRFLANRQKQPDTWTERFDLWTRLPWQHSVYGLERIVRHLQVADARQADDNVTVLHFADLRADPLAAMTTIADALGLDRSSARLEELALHAGIDHMRTNASDYAPVTKGQLRDPQQFFRSGTGGEWQALVPQEALGRYDTRLRALLDPEQRSWLERA